MNIGQRNLRKVISAFFKWRNYIALFNMLRNYPNFWDSFERYFIGSGKYPYKIDIRTPLGIISPKIYSYHDMLTVNEVFCREDYYTACDCKVVVDIGSNIGISALYFLTRNKYCKCYLFEPVPENVAKIKENLKPFEGRYYLQQKAVSDSSGESKFDVEPTGRYGGLKQETGKTITVLCSAINDILAEILNKEQLIDVLKIDIEGNEVPIIQSINPNFLNKIRIVYFEFHDDADKNIIFNLPYRVKKHRGVYVLAL